MDILKLQLLTNDNKLIELAQSYWLQDESGGFQYTVSKLSQYFSLSSSKILSVVNSSCNALSTKFICNCGKPYNYDSRADFQQKSKKGINNWKCKECTELEYKKVQQERLEQQKNQRKKLYEMLSIESQRFIHPIQLNLEDAIYYVSLLRLGASEDFQFISPLSTFISDLSPSSKFNEEILTYLYNKNLIAIHPESSLDAFSFYPDGIRFSISKVMWLPLVSHEIGKQKIAIEYLEDIFMTAKWPSHWENHFIEIGKKIALLECLQYLEHSLDEHTLPFKAGEKTELVIKTALEYFSVAQIYNIIWRAVKDAAAFYVREKVVKQHAANTVVGKIQRSVEQARDRNWDVTAFGRSYNLPQTMISQVLFSSVLHIADGGFTIPPKQWIKPQTDLTLKVFFNKPISVPQKIANSPTVSNNTAQRRNTKSSRKKKRKK